MLRRTVFLTIALLLSGSASAAHAGSLAFGPLNQLPNGDPAKHPYWSGAEPSLSLATTQRLCRWPKLLRASHW